jgi:hypothetical protein
MRRYWTAVVLVVLTALLVAGVAEAKKQPKIIKVSYLKLDPAEQSPVTKNGVTLAVAYTAATDPRFRVMYLSATEKDIWGQPAKKTIPNLFVGSVVLDVAITNNTGHVLRTNGSAVSLVPADGSEPIPAYTIQDLSEAWAAQGVSGVEKYLAENKVRVIKLETDVILPGATLKGLMPFRAKVEGIKGCTLNILDLVTATDAAGNPTERTNFDFKFTEQVTEMEEQKK